MFDLDVIVEADGWPGLLGADPETVVRVTVDAVASSRPDRSEPKRALSLAVMLADDGELQRLNRDFRGQDKPTNVLSFPAPAGVGALGDVALALETVAREAREQDKSPLDHTRHLIVHGILHLLGYDHETDADAAQMEAHERCVLAALGVADPYE